MKKTVNITRAWLTEGHSETLKASKMQSYVNAIDSIIL